mmetsp:Transcript_6249/g.9555  ORF Transcript_6249/g.9555 Transcript_6249/m.9555 type:complete len:261 (-) Transcript_6249:758-1540(-)
MLSICLMRFEKFCIPPILCNICGLMAPARFCIFRSFSPACMRLKSNPLLPIIFSWSATRLNCLNVSMTSQTTLWSTPEPTAILKRRSGCALNILRSLSSSLFVMLSMTVINRLILCCDASSLPSPIKFLNPGIMLITLPNEPRFMSVWNWSYISRNVNSPPFDVIFCTSFSCDSITLLSSMISLRPWRFPMPSSWSTKALVSNLSNWSMCSPVPMKVIGLPVAATALRAPPPLACPSSLVMIIDPTSTAPWNAVACNLAA